MTMRMLRLFLIALCVCVLTADAADKPNIVIIYGDDIGYGDFGCYVIEEALTQLAVRQGNWKYI